MHEVRAVGSQRRRRRRRCRRRARPLDRDRNPGSGPRPTHPANRLRPVTEVIDRRDIKPAHRGSKRVDSVTNSRAEETVLDRVRTLLACRSGNRRTAYEGATRDETACAQPLPRLRRARPPHAARSGGCWYRDPVAGGDSAGRVDLSVNVIFGSLTGVFGRVEAHALRFWHLSQARSLMGAVLVAAPLSGTRSKATALHHRQGLNPELTDGWSKPVLMASSDCLPPSERHGGDVSPPARRVPLDL